MERAERVVVGEKISPGVELNGSFNIRYYFDKSCRDIKFERDFGECGAWRGEELEEKTTIGVKLLLKENNLVKVKKLNGGLASVKVNPELSQNKIHGQ